MGNWDLTVKSDQTNQSCGTNAALTIASRPGKHWKKNHKEGDSHFHVIGVTSSSFHQGGNFLFGARTVSRIRCRSQIFGFREGLSSWLDQLENFIHAKILSFNSPNYGRTQASKMRQILSRQVAFSMYSFLPLLFPQAVCWAWPGKEYKAKEVTKQSASQ